MSLVTIFFLPQERGPPPRENPLHYGPREESEPDMAFPSISGGENHQEPSY